MRLLTRALLPLSLLVPAACVAVPENGSITNANVATYVVGMSGFTTQPGRTVQMEVLSPPEQDPFDATSTWAPLGEPVTSSLTAWGYYGYDDLYAWSHSVPLAEAGNGSLLTWRDEGVLRVRAREVESNTTLITVDDVDCLIDHLGEPALDVVSACASEYPGVITVLSEVHDPPAPGIPFLSWKNHDEPIGGYLYAELGYSDPADLRFGDWLDEHRLGSSGTVEALYFNGSDLALGRHMNCRHVYASEAGEVCEGNSSGAGELLRTACYVTNYGEPGGTPADAFADMDAHQAFATVGMVKYYHDPNLADCAATLASPVPAVDDVRFFVWGHSGPPDELDGALTSAELDSGGFKPAPEICLNCHGGKIEDELISFSLSGAKFLPFDVDLFAFDPTIGGGKANQMEAFRQLNEIVLDTEQEGQPDHAPASELAELIMTWYEGVPDENDPAPIRTAQTPYNGDARPEAWLDPYDESNSYPYQHELYQDLIRPYCRMCHIAFEDNFPDEPNKDITFGTPQSYQASANLAAYYVCNDFVMPHAEVTSGLFWDSNARMIVLNEGGADLDCTPYAP